MAVHVSFLLILTGLTGIHSITTVSKVSVRTGGSVSIPCFYESEYKNHVKYLCKGAFWVSCSSVVKTNQHSSSGKFSISYDQSRRIFTVTIKDVTDKDTDYWCIVEMNDGPDYGKHFQLSVTGATPSLYVDQQEVTGFKGGNITISCRYSNPGVIKWCKLGSFCVTGPTGSIDGTTVTIDASVPNVFTVTMHGLMSSGWYYCVKGDLQMPVHVTLNEQPTTTTTAKLLITLPPTPDLTLVFTSEAPTAQGGYPSPSDHLKIFSIRLSVLTFAVMVTLFIWFIVKRYSK
ncbi:CMRF35-like molecule 1 [Centropristis striata]|uniref:CMRF35-like molecule 1 n=1 Tax=Centropristis striata TaxID=184440 RepID=UPI0027DF6275|nr:CMRF35-like molecule 1 [Centropristis striata]